MEANRDPLTGIGNRRGLLAALEEAAAGDGPVAVVSVDVDQFDALNREHGKDAGDRVLVAVANAVRTWAGAAGGAAFRGGGDEFTVILPGVSLEQAFLSAEAFRREQVPRLGQNGVPAVTLSIGVAQYPRDGRDAAEALRAADAACYLAKDAGRDRVALPPNEEMVMRSCYYRAAAIRRLKQVAERVGHKESVLLREALDDLLEKYESRPA